jgi:hypothetical protein
MPSKAKRGSRFLDLYARARRSAKATQNKSLANVATLAQILAQLGALEDAVEIEAALAADENVSEQIAAALRLLGSAIIDMTAAEVADLLAVDDGGESTSTASAAISARRRRARMIELCR